MRTISKEKARILASYWHGGQWSQLYAFTSSGSCNYIEAINEVLNSIYHQETALRPYDLPKYQVKQLNQLKAFFEKEIGTPVNYQKNYYGFIYALPDGENYIFNPTH